ncbi:MAG: amidohydrolase family protein, partial [Bacteroidota bacterium]|nr:amidohydrolase family protein [Bacteroidota bacterium]
MKKTTFFGLLFFWLLSVSAQKTILHCGKLVDTRNGKLLPEMTVVVEGNLITDVLKGYVSGSKEDKVIDLTHRTVMPGLMDMHVHMEDEVNPGSYLNKFTWNKADFAL